MASGRVGGLLDDAETDARTVESAASTQPGGESDDGSRPAIVEGQRALRGLARSLGLLLLTGLVLGAALGGRDARPGGQILVLALVAVCAAALVRSTTRPRARWTVLLVALSISTSGAAPYLVADNGAQVLPYTLTWLASAASITVVLTARRLAIGIGLGALCAAACLVALWLAADDVGLVGLDPSIPVLNLAVVSLAAYFGVRGFELTHRIVRRTEEVSRSFATASAQVAQLLARDREIHDGLLSAISALGTGMGGVPPETVRAACAAELADNAPPRAFGPGRAATNRISTGLAASARSAAEEVGLDLRVHLDSEGGVGAGGVASPDVIGAAASALREGIRNIAAHADVSSADLVISFPGGGLHVVLSDSGTGFDVEAVPADRLGVRGSIVGRSRAVGGRADVWSRPGRGTTLSLLFPLGRP